ncbi:lysozyme C [Mycteria americana]|uniref:lysozyme C n=1 Tax=Mycteria americana TaxID=33587 RepID=UPI003F5887D7
MEKVLMVVMGWPGARESWVILAFCLLPLAALGKVYKKCELAATMKRLGPNNFWGTQPGKSRILRTNSCWWCNGGRTPRAKHMCNIPCSD